MSSAVSRPAAAPSHEALAHFEALLAFETDCWDVRGEDLWKKAHVAKSISLPHARINEETLAAWPADTLFVVYCAGPHCNATEKAAIRLARLGRPVKKMIGGICGWLDEGFTLETDDV